MVRWIAVLKHVLPGTPLAMFGIEVISIPSWGDDGLV